MRGKHWLALAVSALLVGGVVVYVLPFGENLLDRVQQPTVRKVFDNRIVQIGLVGAIVMAGMGIFFAVANALRLPNVGE